MVDFSTRESTPGAVADYLRSWSGASFHEDLPAPSVPVTAIAGPHDPALGPETMKVTWLEQLPGCRLEVLAEAGHYAMFETPVALATLLEKSLPESP
jgi:pimeloyl-ACP methyl ester carboxylesterase